MRATASLYCALDFSWAEIAMITGLLTGPGRQKTHKRCSLSGDVLIMRNFLYAHFCWQKNVSSIK